MARPGQQIHSELNFQINTVEGRNDGPYEKFMTAKIYRREFISDLGPGLSFKTALYILVY